MRLLLHYYYDVNKFNWLFSGLVWLLFSSSENSFLALSLSLLSAGFVLGLLIFHVRKENEYFFYFNRGFSKIHLTGACLAFNTLLLAIIYVVKELIH